MASTYTTNLRLTKQADGENPNSWGQILNDGVISLADQAIAGLANITMVSASTAVTLTGNDGASDQSRNAFLKISGSATNAHQLIIPANSKSYSVLNTASGTGVVLMKTAAGTGVTIERSSTAFQHVVCDGTSVYNVAPTKFSSLTVDGDAIIGGKASVVGNLIVTGSQNFNGAGTFNSTLLVSGALTVTGAVTLAGAAILKSTVTVEGAQVNKSTTRFEGAVSLASGAPVHQIITTITDAASIVMNMATNNQFVVTLGGNRTLAAPTNLTVGQTGHIYAIQDGTGSRTMGYNSVFKFSGGTDPTLSTAANAVDLLVFSVRAADKVDAVMVNDLK